MLKPMSINEMAKLTGRSPHLVRTVVQRLQCVPTHGEPVGRHHRQFYQPEPVLLAVKALKPSVKHGPSRRD